jgi:hypothetical protein
MNRVASPASIVASAAALTLLSACGLRGDLERPEPLFGEPAVAVEAELKTEEKPFADDPQAQRGPRFNELGGEIPDAAPAEPVEELPFPTTPATPPKP